MSPRLARPLALLIVAACVAMTGFSLASLVLPGSERLPGRPSLFDFVVFMTSILAFPLVGSMIAWRRPSNPVGWLLLATGLSMVLAVFAGEYPGRSVLVGPKLPADEIVVWLGTWAWFLGPSIALPLAIVVFPDGRFPGRRWTIPFGLAVGAAGLMVLATALVPGPIAGWEEHFVNPAGAPGALGELARQLSEAGVLAMIAPGLVAIAATVARLRRASGPARQQLKWLLLPLALFVAGIAGAIITWQPIVWTLALGGLAMVPVGIGIAVLRYRLYDIDLVIRRTLVYGAMVAVLAGVYGGLVVGLQALLSGVTGGEALPVALSTLATAALFGPVRRRIREVVDRRFYRSRYDAQRTLDAFVTHLRDEVEPETAAGVLAATASNAVRPTTVTVWLRPAPVVARQRPR